MPSTLQSLLSLSTTLALTSAIPIDPAAPGFLLPSSEHCGLDDRLIMPGLPWTVSNAMYNSQYMDGTQCTNYEHVYYGSGSDIEDTKHLRVDWTSITHIRYADETEDACKGYSNIGIGVNLNHKFSEIKAIPAFFSWNRTTEEGKQFKGANVFDFITSPKQWDTESVTTHEFMLWLQWWGGQVPIGFNQGPIAQLDMYGQKFDLYYGKNELDIEVWSCLVVGGGGGGTDQQQPFQGQFNGDIKEWLSAMAARGYIQSDDYVTVGNAGTEVFYGDSVQKATVALDIEV